MTSSQQWNHLMTDSSEHILIIKQHTRIFCFLIRSVCWGVFLPSKFIITVLYRFLCFSQLLQKGVLCNLPVEICYFSGLCFSGWKTVLLFLVFLISSMFFTCWSWNWIGWNVFLFLIYSQQIFCHKLNCRGFSLYLFKVKSLTQANKTIFHILSEFIQFCTDHLLVFLNILNYCIVYVYIDIFYKCIKILNYSINFWTMLLWSWPCSNYFPSLTAFCRILYHKKES
jgi:hypothetical protein